MLSSAYSNNNNQPIGPNVLGCQDDFDFTVKFEQLFFSLTPSALLIILCIWRVITFARRTIVVEAPYLWLGKLGAIVSYVSLELVLIILNSTGSFGTTSLAISASSSQLVAALFLLSAYLFLTLLFDIAQARTFWLLSQTRSETVFAAVFTTALIIKVAVVFLEAQKKRRDGRRASDPYPLDTVMASARLHSHLAKHKLLLVLSRTLLSQLLLPVLPRLALIGFTLSQSFFIENLIDYLAKPIDSVSANDYGFIGVGVLIYGGIAISTALYSYFRYRVLYMTCGALVSAIYVKTTEARMVTRNGDAPLTLMSTGAYFSEVRKGG
ncbi:hypothetical protein GGR58DRAFT_509205 [Xylaria digitata]|nr:hypothetical protein GGR58DRAFT_509205 [Xylaria digitata]